MKTSDLREMSADELLHKMGELKDQLFKLRIQNTQSRIENPARLQTLRRDIARIQTILNERSAKTE